MKECFIPKQVEESELAENISKENRRTSNALKILDAIPAIIILNYSDLIRNCEHNNPGNMALTYNRGLLALMEGRTGEFLSSVSAFIDFARQRSNQKLLSSDIFQRQGEAFLEVGLYQEAVEALNTAIEKDPQNSEAYFQRAVAYFELGNVDQSLADYVHVIISSVFSKLLIKAN
jgi:tetratricopeptide (TPR) repeat protein